MVKGFIPDLDGHGESDSSASPHFRARNNAFDLAFSGKGSVMRFVEPAFDVGGEFWPAPPADPGADIRALENTIAELSAELNLRVTEIVELYNVQQQQANELQSAYEEIDRLNQVISVLQRMMVQHKTDVAAAQDKIVLFENEKAALRAQLDEALRESRTLASRLLGMQAAFNVRETNVASALEQVEFLNSEIVTASAERFKLVAAAQGEKRRHRSALSQQTSTLEDKIKKAEALAATQEVRIKHLEAVRGKLDKRLEVLEALLKSEREIAELKITRLTEQLQRDRPAQSTADVQ
jgi:chromosome segregation ATPase